MNEQVMDPVEQLLAAVTAYIGADAARDFARDQEAAEREARTAAVEQAREALARLGLAL